MIDRLCALADMPKPRVGVADIDLPNAFATGRSPDRAVVCVTTGILGKLTAEELEAVLAHELSHVAHRDVLVMTIASSAGIVAGMLDPRRSVRRARHARPAQQQRRRAVVPHRAGVSLVVYAISFFLIRLLSRYRELVADRAGCLPDPEAGGAGLRAAEDHRRDGGDPAARPARGQAMNAFFIAPAISGASLKTLTSTHPSLEQRLEQLARIQAELGRPTG